MQQTFLSKDYQDLSKVAGNFKDKYQNAKPFPNIYFDNFFNEQFLDKILQEFPDLSKKKEIHFSNPNEEKHATKGENSFGENSRLLAHFLNSQPFLEFLQQLTGIPEFLIPDPYLDGGGFHQIKPGGFLKVHVDFHKQRNLGLDRRLNLLIYLNKDWKEAYGGHFELWEKDMSACSLRILPVFNRVALFSTSGYSYHGHPDPLTCPEDRSRKSMAFYYYSNGRTDDLDSVSRQRITTKFAARKGKDANKMKRYNKVVNLANDLLPPIVVRTIKKFRNT